MSDSADHVNDALEQDAELEQEYEDFWADACIRAGLNPSRPYFGPNPVDSIRPPAWSFGADSATADALLALVLASALWDYEAAGEPLPQAGSLAIVTDGVGHPRALIRTNDVRVVPFGEVTEAHAHAEGEGDRSLAHWRQAHERFFRHHAGNERGFEPDMPVVLETFEVLVPRR